MQRGKSDGLGVSQLRRVQICSYSQTSRRTIIMRSRVILSCFLSLPLSLSKFLFTNFSSEFNKTTQIQRSW
ncbi:unnamed protein product [Citrullus colocynthis]|uniref:Uncharacterized protein n=1 Tax=Citrullus colocynthis TaxID=252529 RepID=A0ABP0XPS3_9ROSI